MYHVDQTSRWKCMATVQNVGYFYINTYSTNPFVHNENFKKTSKRQNMYITLYSTVLKHIALRHKEVQIFQTNIHKNAS